MWIQTVRECPSAFLCVYCEKEGVKKCIVIFFAWPKVCGKGSDSAFGVRHSTRERSNSEREDKSWKMTQLQGILM